MGADPLGTCVVTTVIALPMVVGSNFETAFLMEAAKAGVSSGTISKMPTNAASAPAVWRMINLNPTASNPKTVTYRPLQMTAPITPG